MSTGTHITVAACYTGKPEHACPGNLVADVARAVADLKPMPRLEAIHRAADWARHAWYLADGDDMREWSDVSAGLGALASAACSWV